jgi:hypothetical protein
MDRVTLRTFVRELTLVKTHEVSDATLDSFLDEGYGRVIQRTEWDFLQTAEQDIAPAAAVFDTSTLTPTFAKVYAIAKKDSPDLALTQTTRSDFYHLIRGRNLTGNVRFFFVENKQIHFYPVPDGTETFVIAYFQQPTWDPGDNDSPDPIPDHYHTVLADWTCHRVWEREEDFERSDSYRGRFESSLTEMLYANNTLDSSRPKIHGEKVLASRGHPNMPWLDGV